MSRKTWDTLIQNALVFDGSGEPPQQLDIAIKKGRIVARGSSLPRTPAAEVIDADGLVVTPGFVNIHTHQAEMMLDYFENVAEQDKRRRKRHLVAVA